MKKSKMMILFVSLMFAILIPSKSPARSANVSIIKENEISFKNDDEFKKVQQIYYFLDYAGDGLCDYVSNNSYFANSFGDYSGKAVSSLNLKLIIKPGTFAGKAYSAKEIENLLANKNYEMGGIAYDESCHFGLNSNQEIEIYNAYDFNNSCPKLILSIFPSTGVCTLEIQVKDTMKVNIGSMIITEIDETNSDQNEQVNLNVYPIPADRELNVELNEYSTSIFSSIQIVDINGTVVAEMLVNKISKLHFNISNLPDGSYFVKGIGNLGAKSIPFIISR